MEEDKRQELEEYRRYLERLAESKSTDMFSNGGKEHASILMSVLLKDTKRALIYAMGFRPDLIKTDPYWGELENYLRNPSNELFVLVETPDYMNAEPLKRLHEVMNLRQDKTVQVRKISPEGRQIIEDRFGKDKCNFAVFNDNKFRFEYDPDKFKAFGSFNQPENCEILSNLFFDAFNASTPLWPN